ncbi:MAG TPA: bifunctional hydroxymethylpyrimidine kinase/phosphomethylpyrimidine kinase [Methanomicrobia archaeon]|nr:bifunctional hydroxymethylpyrimidine kinase/phosphomethylpyrimidine kinase [Methanomicrobia archaeon]
MRAKRVLTIAGSDSSGGAGIQADIKSFAALGVHGMSVITAITAQNSSGVHAVHEVPVEMVAAQLAAITADEGLRVDYAKTGMLYSTVMIETVARALERSEIPFVLDPVMKAGAGGALIEDAALHALTLHLLPLCAVITPNVPEAEILSGLPIRTKDAVKAAARAIHALGAGAVIIKGGHLADELAAGRATDVLYDGAFAEISAPLVRSERIVHGGGCTFSAALAAELAKGKPVQAAAATAKGFVHDAIVNGEFVSGLLVVNQTQGLQTDADRYGTAENVRLAVGRLKATIGFEQLIPEVGTNIGMAIDRATGVQDVAAVDGRIVRTAEGVRAGCVAFGASDHVARLILAMRAQNRAYRSALNVTFAPEILAACHKLGMTVSTFERDREPEDANTMDWGVAEASKAFVPDVIFDRGAVGKEPMIRIFGTSAVEVVEKVRRIVAALTYV